ncbi:Putative DNA-binding protein in cluster with Type I restriction-modification system [hydrothermal vent metagenome]|uniref:DNA-binding protein in cluster with Type I restriction-modification system n=1 Tax=hydrothermal vent metagenome TaxID=652676 RepID=A0A3B0W5J9_9ZZZZ
MSQLSYMEKLLEDVWLTQKMMGALYDVETNTVNYHLKKIFSDSELEENAVIRNFRITAKDGKNYNLSAELKITVTNIDKLHTDIDAIVAEIEGGKV